MANIQDNKVDISKQIADDVKRNGLGTTAAHYQISEADAYGAFYKHYNAKGHVTQQPKKSIWQSIVSVYNAVDKATDSVLEVMDETFGGSAINRATIDVRKNVAQTAYVVKETAKEVSAGIIGDAQQAGANLADLVSRTYGTPSAVAVTGDGRVYMSTAPHPSNSSQHSKGDTVSSQGQGLKDLDTGFLGTLANEEAQAHANARPAQKITMPEGIKMPEDEWNRLPATVKASASQSPAAVEVINEFYHERQAYRGKQEQELKEARDTYTAAAKRAAELDESNKAYARDLKVSKDQNVALAIQKSQVEDQLKEAKAKGPQQLKWYQSAAAIVTMLGASIIGGGIVGGYIGASGKEAAVAATEKRVAEKTNKAVEGRYKSVVVNLEKEVTDARSDAEKLGAKFAVLRGQADDADMARQEAEKRVNDATTELNAVKSTVKKVNEDYAAAEKRAADVAAEASKLKQNLNNVLQNATIAQSTATDAEKKLNVLTQKYEAMTKKHDQMTKQYETLSKVAETVKGNETAYAAKLSEAEKRVAAVTSEKQTLESQLAKARQDYATLQEQKAVAQATVDRLVVEGIPAAEQKGSLIDRWNGKQDSTQTGQIVPVLSEYNPSLVSEVDFVGSIAQGLGMTPEQFKSYHGSTFTSNIKPTIDNVRVETILDAGMKSETKNIQAEHAKRDAEAAKKLAEKQAKEQREAAEKQKRDVETAKKAVEKQAEQARKDAEAAKKLAAMLAREAAEAAKRIVNVTAPQAAKQANTVQPASYKTKGGLDVLYAPIAHTPHMLAELDDAEGSRTAGVNEHIAQIDKIYGKFDPKKATDAETYARLMTESNYWRSAVEHGGEVLFGDSKRGQLMAMHYLTLELAHTLGVNSGVLKDDALAQSKQQLDNTALMYLHDESDSALADKHAKFAPRFASLDQKVSVSRLKQLPPLDMLAALSSATPSQAIEAAKSLKGTGIKSVKDFDREARYLDGRLQKDTEKMRDKKLEFEHALYDYVVAQFANGAMPRNIDFSLLFCPPQPGTPAMNKVGDRLGEIVTTATLFQQKYAPVKGEEKLNKRGVPTLLTDWAIEARNGAYLKAKQSDFNVTLSDLMKLHWQAYASKTALANADTANGKSYKLSDLFTDMLHDQPHDENQVNRLFLGHYGRERGIVQSEAYMRVLKDGEWRGMAAILNEARKAVQTYFIIKSVGGFGNGGGSNNGGGVGGNQGGGGGVGPNPGGGVGGSQGGGGGVFGPGSDNKKASEHERKQFAKATKRSRLDQQKEMQLSLSSSPAYNWVMAHTAKPQPKKTVNIGGMSFTQEA